MTELQIEFNGIMLYFRESGALLYVGEDFCHGDCHGVELCHEEEGRAGVSSIISLEVLESNANNQLDI